MKLIFAQGNPGPEYAMTRHNIGWVILDAFAREYDTSFQMRDKFKSEIAETTIHDEKVLFVRPQTFYNETGPAARAIADFYKLETADVLVIHDELALPFGTVRTREKGSDAGNNGIKSLNTHLGPDYKRIRVGVWNERRDQMGDVNFVLGKLSKDEQDALPEIIQKTHRIIDGFIVGSFTSQTV